MAAQVLEADYLSVQDTRGQMAWAQQSRLRYFTLAGSEVMRVFRDFPAQIVQHTIIICIGACG